MDLLEERVRAEEDRVAEQAEREGKRFLGLGRLERQRHTDTPLSREPRRNLNPQLACKSKWRRVEALRRHKEFQWEYREAYERWRQGDRSAIFPEGTYAMVWVHHALCARLTFGPP